MVTTIVRPKKASREIKEAGTLKQTSKNVDTDYFASNISPTAAPAIHRIMINLSVANVVRIELDDGSNTNIAMNLNEGNSLSADTAYIFDILVPAGYSYNVQHDTATATVDCVIVELGA